MDSGEWWCERAYALGEPERKLPDCPTCGGTGIICGICGLGPQSCERGHGVTYVPSDNCPRCGGKGVLYG